jgi:hypothetical protein
VSAFEVAVRRMRERRLRRLLLTIGVLVLALAGVALLPQGQHPGVLAVATSDRSGRSAPNGVVQGPVTATRSGHLVCFSVAAAQGRVLLELPPGWSADARLRLLDASGQTRVRPGAAMAFLGSPGSVGAVPGCSGTGRIWFVSDVRLPSRTG